MSRVHARHFDEEQLRLKMLALLEVMHTSEDEFFDRLTKLASIVCEAPIALLSFVDADRIWFKSCFGIDLQQVTRAEFFCDQVVRSAITLSFSDLDEAGFFEKACLAGEGPRIRFYAGAPLFFEQSVVGVFSIADTSPRDLSDQQKRILEMIAEFAITRLIAQKREKLRMEAEKLVQTHKSLIESSARMSSLGEMASSIAHEINNPLTAIMSRSEQIRDSVHENKIDVARIEAAAKSIEEIALRISKTVKALKTFSRGDETEPPVSVDPADIVSDTLSLCEEKFRHRVDLRVEIENGLPGVLCHPVQISQVLLNLLSNGFDAVIERDEPAVTLRVGRIATSPEQIEFSVIDNGEGVPESLRERVLEPFFTTKAVGKGTGLGLTISQRILNQHESKLTIRSRPSMVSFSLKSVTPM